MYILCGKTKMQYLKQEDSLKYMKSHNKSTQNHESQIKNIDFAK